MNVLKILWQHLFQQRSSSSDETVFSAASLSAEALLGLVEDIDFQELATENGSLQLRFVFQEGHLESSSEELVFKASELFLEFEPPTFPDAVSELDEAEMQGLCENFWEEYVFDEGFAKDIPNFAEPEFHPLPFDALRLDEHVKQNFQQHT